MHNDSLSEERLLAKIGSEQVSEKVMKQGKGVNNRHSCHNFLMTHLNLDPATSNQSGLQSIASVMMQAETVLYSIRLCGHKVNGKLVACLCAGKWSTNVSCRRIFEKRINLGTKVATNVIWQRVPVTALHRKNFVSRY